MSLPTESKARKAVPLFEGFVGYFPDAMAEVARLSAAGNEKHNPGQPLHWDRAKSTDHPDCILRHQAEFDQTDQDDGFHHATKVAWRAMAQLQELLERERRLPPSRNSRNAAPHPAKRAGAFDMSGSITVTTNLDAPGIVDLFDKVSPPLRGKLYFGGKSFDISNFAIETKTSERTRSAEESLVRN